jgi:phosphoenolpyruvate carboxykinase (GTP)
VKEMTTNLIMNPYLEALQPKLSTSDFKKLSAINNPIVHEFIAKENDLCHPKDIFICSDSAEDITYLRKQAIASGEEQAILTLQGHTVHFDGEHDQVPCAKRSYFKQSP